VSIGGGDTTFSDYVPRHITEGHSLQNISF
jgi:hypothetical protein